MIEAVCLLSLLMWFGFLYRPKSTWKENKEKSPQDMNLLGRYLKWIQIVIILIVVFAIVKGVNGRWLAVGYIVSFLAMTLIHWAKKNLGVNFSECTDMYVPKEITETGPYAYIRHPIYTGNLLFLFGLSLATQSALLALMTVGFAYLYNQSAQKEEAELTASFPGYAEYVQRTGRFIPRKLTR